MIKLPDSVGKDSFTEPFNPELNTHYFCVYCIFLYYLYEKVTRVL